MSRAQYPEEDGKYRSRIQKRTKNKRNLESVKAYRLRKKIANCLMKQPKKRIRLQEGIKSALKVANSDRPTFILDNSKIRGAGFGVFVSKDCPIAPRGSIIPYAGRISKEKSNHHVNAEYHILLKKKRYLIGNKYYRKGQPLGNFINRRLLKTEWKEFLKYKDPEDTQDMSEPNAKLYCNEEVAYMKLLTDVASGQEILTVYGRGFKIVKPVVE